MVVSSYLRSSRTYVYAVWPQNISSKRLITSILFQYIANIKIVSFHEHKLPEKFLIETCRKSLEVDT